jgi:uncharacterized protein (TIGR03000 family)
VVAAIAPPAIPVATVIAAAPPAGNPGQTVRADTDRSRDVLQPVSVTSDPETAPASITVRLPAEARLWVDGVYCPLVSDTRTFQTPRLQPGQQYAYTMKAELIRDGRTVTQNQRVLMSAGRQVEVTFGELAPASVTRR